MVERGSNSQLLPPKTELQPTPPRCRIVSQKKIRTRHFDFYKMQPIVNAKINVKISRPATLLNAPDTSIEGGTKPICINATVMAW